MTSIKLGSSATNTNYGDAVLVQSSTFERVDGTTGQAGSFILAQNNFVRQFIPITVSAAASALPGIKGSGMVRDLHEATRSPRNTRACSKRLRSKSRSKYGCSPIKTGVSSYEICSKLVLCDEILKLNSRLSDTIVHKRNIWIN